MKFSEMAEPNKDAPDNSGSAHACIEPEFRKFEPGARFNFHYTSHLKNSRLLARVFGLPVWSASGELSPFEKE